MSRPRQNHMAQADKLFSKFIRLRDENCQNCGSPDFLQCAHIHSRSYKSIRVNPENAVALCRACHTFYTHRPLEWIAWVEKKYPGRWDRLKDEALEFGKVDWVSERRRLQSALEEL